MTTTPAVTRTAIICLPGDLDPEDLWWAASDQLARFHLGDPDGTACDLDQHFLTRPQSTRRRRRAASAALLWPDGRTAAGGPTGLLDVDAMRQLAWAGAWAHWQLWQHTVAGTPTAKPWWVFYDRHRDNPARYQLATAQRDYCSQPRVQAMAAHNAIPDRWAHLDTGSLEALQAGQTTYSNLAAAAAVPADMVIAGPVVLSCRQDRLTDQIDYLQAANAAIHGAAFGSLVAVTLTLP